MLKKAAWKNINHLKNIRASNWTILGNTQIQRQHNLAVKKKFIGKIESNLKIAVIKLQFEQQELWLQRLIKKLILLTLF
jgi:hypothetical protein